MGPFKVLQLKALQNISVSCIFPAAVRARWCWYNSTRRSIDAPLTRGKGKRGGRATTQLEIGTFSHARTHTHVLGERNPLPPNRSVRLANMRSLRRGKKLKIIWIEPVASCMKLLQSLTAKVCARVCVSALVLRARVCVCGGVGRYSGHGHWFSTLLQLYRLTQLD